MLNRSRNHAATDNIIQLLCSNRDTVNFKVVFVLTITINFKVMFFLSITVNFKVMFVLTIIVVKYFTQIIIPRSQSPIPVSNL